MSLLLMSLLMAQARVLPEIDRRALDLQARAEALGARRVPPPQTSVAARPQRVTPARVRTAAARPAQPQATQRGAVRNASNGGSLDLSAITTICRAAGSQSDPAGFLATLSRAYAMTADDSASLRTSCAAYLASRADARTAR